MGYRLCIALRYLLSPKSHSAVNVISMVSVGGVAIAVAAIVCVLSVFNGFNDLVTTGGDSVIPDVAIVPTTGKTIANSDSLTELIEQLDGVQAVSPGIEDRALAIGINGHQIPVRMLGVTPDFTSVSRLPESLIDGIYGLYSTDTPYPAAVMGAGVAMDLELRPSPEALLGLVVPRREGRINPANPTAAFRSDTLTATGVFQTDRSEYDSEIVIAPIECVARLLEHDSATATSIYVALAPGATESRVIEQLTDILPKELSIKNRADQQETSLRMIAIEKWITFAMMVFILLVASFNIISTLSMLIIEKAQTIGILRSLGASASDITAIFNRTGWLICGAGAIAGIIAGTVLCLLQQHLGLIHLNGDSSMLITDVYPVRLNPVDLTAVAIAAIAVAVMTSVFTTPFTRRYISSRVE
ncbi:MAG: ABC transporter permease [Muribaculum sp.]|nr:ABC transporter permease [Muribaculum sp.]